MESGRNWDCSAIWQGEPDTGKHLQYNSGWRVPAHCGVTNLVRSGTKQPQSFPVSAADQARQFRIPYYNPAAHAICVAAGLLYVALEFLQHNFLDAPLFQRLKRLPPAYHGDEVPLSVAYAHHNAAIPRLQVLMALIKKRPEQSAAQ